MEHNLSNPRRTEIDNAQRLRQSVADLETAIRNNRAALDGSSLNHADRQTITNDIAALESELAQAQRALERHDALGRARQLIPPVGGAVPRGSLLDRGRTRLPFGRPAGSCGLPDPSGKGPLDGTPAEPRLAESEDVT